MRESPVTLHSLLRPRTAKEPGDGFEHLIQAAPNEVLLAEKTQNSGGIVAALVAGPACACGVAGLGLSYP
jgi:hypothetical protein